MKRGKTVAGILTVFLFVWGILGIGVSAQTEYGTLTMDTRSYVMAPGDIYDFRAKVEGGDLSQDEVTVSDSRTGSVVKLSRVAGTDKYRVTAVNEGVCYVVAEIRGTHASIRIEVQNGAQAHGEAVRSVTLVPVGQWASEKDPAQQVSEPEQESLEALADQVFALTNQEREKENLPLLERRSDVEIGAMKRADEIQGTFSHTRPDGSAFYTAVDLDYRTCGENIAMGYPTPEAVVDGWMNSPGHRANILNGDFEGIGIGVSEKDGTLYWVQIFWTD